MNAAEQIAWNGKSAHFPKQHKLVIVTKQTCLLPMLAVAHFDYTLTRNKVAFSQDRKLQQAETFGSSSGPWHIISALGKSPTISTLHEQQPAVED